MLRTGLYIACAGAAGVGAGAAAAAAAAVLMNHAAADALYFKNEDAGDAADDKNTVTPLQSNDAAAVADDAGRLLLLEAQRQQKLKFSTKVLAAIRSIEKIEKRLLQLESNTENSQAIKSMQTDIADLRLELQRCDAEKLGAATMDETIAQIGLLVETMTASESEFRTEILQRIEEGDRAIQFKSRGTMMIDAGSNTADRPAAARRTLPPQPKSHLHASLSAASSSSSSLSHRRAATVLSAAADLRRKNAAAAAGP